jgi:hypothetical protein
MIFDYLTQIMYLLFSKKRQYNDKFDDEIFYIQIIKSIKNKNIINCDYDNTADVDVYENCIEFDYHNNNINYAVKIDDAYRGKLYVLECENYDWKQGEYHYVTIYWSASLDEILDFAKEQFDDDCVAYGTDEENSNDVVECLLENGEYSFIDVHIRYNLYTINM